MYLDTNNVYGWAMCKKLPLNRFIWAKNADRYTSDFIKNYDENSDLGYLLEVDISYPMHLHELHSDLTFLPIKKNKLLATLEDKRKDFFKLMNNSLFSKTMENVRGHRDVKLVVTEERRKKLVSEPNYDSWKQFTNDLLATEMRKTEVLMDKPIAVGQAMLDIRYQ